jgi:hypothetical protein
LKQPQIHFAERGISTPGGETPSMANMVHEPSKAQFFVAKHLVKVKDMVLDRRETIDNRRERMDNQQERRGERFQDILIPPRVVDPSSLYGDSDNGRPVSINHFECFICI